MSRRALLSGTVGGVIGVITTAIGIIWVIVIYTFSVEMYNYVIQLSLYLGKSVFGQGYMFPSNFPYPPLNYPSSSLLNIFSFVLVIFLIVTGILIGAGFYGTYKIGGGDASVVGIVSSIIGITSGALLIIIGNLTTRYTAVSMDFFDGFIPLIPLLIPNFPVIWIGFVTLGLTFIILGSASYSIREMTSHPSASSAAGILSIMGAAVSVLSILMSFLTSILHGDMPACLGSLIVVGACSLIVVGLFINFVLILVAFILWTTVFYYSSRNL